MDFVEHDSLDDFLDRLEQQARDRKELSPKVNTDEIIEEKEDFAQGNELLSPYVINTYVQAFRDLLKGEEKSNNLFRFILAENKNAPIEKAKIYFPDIAVVGCIAVQDVIDAGYEIGETYQDAWDDIEPASEIDATIGYKQEVTCFENGIIELINNETKKRLNVYVNAEVQKPFVKAYCVEGSGEANVFIKKVQERIKQYDIYKNKTFTLKRSAYVGMIPQFLKPTTVMPKVIITEEVEKILQSNIIDIFEKQDLYKNCKIPLKRGILLEGEPGCGKSSIVKHIEFILAGQVTFIYVTDGAIRGASDIADIYSMARQYAPTIVVLEDIDTIGLTRERGSNNFTSELLGQLDGLEVLEGVVTIATTNYPDAIDDALKNRPSRFDRRIKIGLPDDKIRERMFKEFLLEKDISIENLDINKLSQKTKEFSGAMLKEVIITAKMMQIQDEIEVVTDAVLLKAIDVIRTNFYDSKISNSQQKLGLRN